ncbi:MAG: hypothetical protein KC944_03365 [Candidatus Omnitrophica bacterium]|nr:hypothetical protein [Candidatus Omnitrophota bacterium]
MNPLTVRSRIKSLETQISVLKAQIASPQSSGKVTFSFGQIYGRLSGVASSTDEEIEEAKYRSPELEASGESSA